MRSRSRQIPPSNNSNPPQSRDFARTEVVAISAKTPLWIFNEVDMVEEIADMIWFEQDSHIAPSAPPTPKPQPSAKIWSFCEQREGRSRDTAVGRTRHDPIRVSKYETNITSNTQEN